MTTKQDNEALRKAAQAKADRGLPLEFAERQALNNHLGKKMADEIIAELNSYRKENATPIQYTQGAADAGRLGIRLAIGTAYALATVQSDKRQKLEAEVLDLRRRIIDLEQRAPQVRGTFDPSKEYRAFDIVALNGASFIARHNNPGPCPGDGWQISAGQGKRGKPGDRGASGPKVVKLHVDGRDLVLTNSDGSTASLDLADLSRGLE